MIDVPGKVHKPHPIDPERLRTKEAVDWCFAGQGFLQCRRCGSKIKIGGTMKVKGEERKRAYAPHRWWKRHSQGKCVE
jgi:hypothetical protein